MSNLILYQYYLNLSILWPIDNSINMNQMTYQAKLKSTGLADALQKAQAIPVLCRKHW